MLFSCHDNDLVKVKIQVPVFEYKQSRRQEKSVGMQLGNISIHFSGKVGIHRKLPINWPELSIYTEDLRQKLRRFFPLCSVMENLGSALQDFYKHRTLAKDHHHL